MSLFKKIIATVTATATMLACLACFTGCGQDTAYALTIDGTKVDAGIYNYFVYCAISDAQSELEEGQELWGDGVTLGASNGQDLTANDWIKYKAIEYCCDYVSTVKYAEELNTSLSATQKKAINNSVDDTWENYEKLFESIGVSKSSFTKAYYNRYYLADNIITSIYGKDGSKAVSDDELMNFMVSVLARVKLSSFTLKDNDGNALDTASLTSLEAKIQGYANRINNGESFDDILDEISATEENASETATVGASSAEEDPYKNETWVYKENTTYSKDFIEHVFTPESYGKAELFKDSDTYYLLQVLNPRERTDYFEEYHDSILKEYKGGEIDALLLERTKNCKIVLNDKAIKRYSPEKINKLATETQSSNS